MVARLMQQRGCAFDGWRRPPRHRWPRAVSHLGGCGHEVAAPAGARAPSVTKRSRWRRRSARARRRQCSRQRRSHRNGTDGGYARTHPQDASRRSDRWPLNPLPRRGRADPRRGGSPPTPRQVPRPACALMSRAHSIREMLKRSFAARAGRSAISMRRLRSESERIRTPSVAA